MKSPEEYNEGIAGTHPNYDDSKTLGSYRTSARQSPNPKEMVKFLGFGVSEKDYDRGFCDPKLNDLPEYDAQNYFDRWSQPKVDDQVEGGPSMPVDWEFRQKDRTSKGFLTRPRIPTER